MNIVKNKYIKNHPDLTSAFIFAFPAYNVRNTEIGAVIGRNQLKRIDKNNKKRNRNLALFLNSVDEKKFRTDFVLEGCSNYAFPLVLKKPDFGLEPCCQGDNILKNMIFIHFYIFQYFINI